MTKKKETETVSEAEASKQDFGYIECLINNVCDNICTIAESVEARHMHMHDNTIVIPLESIIYNIRELKDDARRLKDELEKLSGKEDDA